ncbi:indolepyruvate ferredoxin oxidoreductase subunit alpha [Clostridium sp. C105KSO13]|uniref:indolepyruvate ferredoxin oxidoreductase subunit alpha n=1 Tax=Clostridium sp. C105KSO13 TaxID=1776045 RepID=UPI0007406D8D|nr:indolepyruvate ferredoxin oxidoreductase subunit alpha [Clostridium sp. C105KSO13]CUX28890.1 indolepyruvate ferredoxin oxidoreductase [Clostridium sp. C105KSO13]
MSANRKLVMGNEAIALGAIRAGVRMVTGYPGTPSTEILETVAKQNRSNIHVEWSVNEKAAMEVGAGAAYAGARTMVTMKQVGLNVASDPLMSLAYVGVKGGMVVISADDPGPISSQTEQDTRNFAQFSKLPVFDPSSPEEAYLMIADAFELSEKYQTPVLFRPTTRICHACFSLTLLPDLEVPEPEGFVRDTMGWVIFPRTSYENHIKIEARNEKLSEMLSFYAGNSVSGGKGKKGIASGGVSYAYIKEVLPQEVPLLKVGTPCPFPERLAKEFIEQLDEVLVLEELDPVIEKELLRIVGKYHLDVTIRGKLTHDTKNAGENSVESIAGDLERFLKSVDEEKKTEPVSEKVPALPVRPPVLCAGCPHRASFYAVKKAMKGKKAIFSGDIGCYTLGNAKPLDMVDTCLCMGADVTIAQGLHIIEKDVVNFAFIGDSTFFASGITGVVNAVYNQTDIVLIVLDNSTTAMTGHQPHPGTGRTMMGDVVAKISIENILKGIGVTFVETVNPLQLDAAVDAVKQAADAPGVRAVIFKSPCIAVSGPGKLLCIDPDECRKCKTCINQLGCPAITINGGTVEIESSLCYGCGLCSQVCPFHAIGEVKCNE